MRDIRGVAKGRQVRSLVAAAVTAILASGVIAACGSSGNSSGTKTTSGSSTVSIKFGDLSPNSTLTPFYVAVDQGFFKKAGLNVSVEKFSGGGATSVAALASGAVQIASGGPVNFIGDLAKKVIDGRLFGQTVDSAYDLVVSKGITNVSQLKGKTIGISGANSSDDIFLHATLEHYGLSPSDVSFLTVGTTAERLTALSTGKIQAIADQSAFRPSELAVGSVLIKSEDNAIKFPNVAFYADGSFIKSNTPALKRFIGAMIKATAWAKQSANESAVVADCEQGSGSTKTECQQTIAWAKDANEAGPYTWSSTFALDTQGIQQGIHATSLVIPAAKSLTLSDVADTSIAGTKP